MMVINLSFEKGNDSNFPGRRQSMNHSHVVILTIAILAVALSNAGIAMGVPPCCAVGGSGGWSGEDLLNNIGSEGSDNQQAKIAGPSANSEPVESEKSILIQPSQVTSKDVILNVDTKPQSYIKGAVHIDYREFMDTSGRPKSTLELSRILGNAGISQSDSLVIYSEDPSAASDVYLILDSLGQESIRILYGGLKGWTIAGKPTESAPAVLAQKSYLFGML
jgi:thiosulfate/3-mercaptopyruvate sulfurtransferase